MKVILDADMASVFAKVDKLQLLARLWYNGIRITTITKGEFMALSTLQERVYQKVKQLSDKQLREVLLFIEFLSLREDKEFKEKLEESEIAPSKDASKPFSLDFNKLTDEELEKKLKAFEKKYQIDSETLYQLYQQGKVPEWIEDRILWASLYRLKKDEIKLFLFPKKKSLEQKGKK